MTEHRIDLGQLARVRDGSGHSVFGASGSSMFLNCLGSLIPNLLAPDEGNPDSAYGTVAHNVGEIWRSSGRKPVHLLGTNEFVESGEWGFLVWIDELMLEYVEQSVSWSAFLPGTHLVEQRVDYSCLTPIPDQGGRLDFAAMRYQHLTVQDEKYGKNEMIFAEENSQLMLYAFGIFLEWDWLYDFQEIVLRISQPRLDHFDEWTCSRERLLEFAQWAKERMHGAWRLDAPRTAGAKQCKFCKVRGSCVAAAKMQADLTEGVFDAIGEPVSVEEMERFKRRLDDDLTPFEIQPANVGTLTTAQLAKLKPFRKTAERWWKAVEHELEMRCAAGEPMDVVGLKPVEARTRRVFRDPKQALERLNELGVSRDEAVREILVTPAKAEALLVKHGRKRKELPDLLGDLVHKPVGKATLVALADKRPTLVDISGAVFEDLTETSETDDYEDA